jgi:hypothetical protein
MTIVVDVANVMGSRPDGWWRDRAGAAARLHAQVVRLAASGQVILPDGIGPAGETSPPGFVLVFEGAANAAVARLPPEERAAAVTLDPARASSGADAAGPARPGEVRAVQARGSGDDAIVAVVRELPGWRVVVTADRELRERCVAAGAAVLGPGWLLAQLRDLAGT